MKHNKIELTTNQFFDLSYTRRESLKLIGSAAALAGISGLGFPSSLFASQQRKKPNIVFILTDDHRWDCLGVMGHPFLQTPNMDRLANEGLLFKNAFVTTSLCSPSRASFLTGQYASVHGVQNNFSRWDETKNITFMEHLKNGGYDTGFIGKWHMPGGSLPNLPGVDLFVSFTKKDGQGDYFNCPVYVNHELTPNKKPYITEELTDYAIDFVKQKRDNPFCLYLSHKAVHHDWKPPEHLKGMYKDADLSHLAPGSDKYNTWTNLNWLEGTMGNMHNVYRRYCECLVSVDEQVGRLIDALEHKGILDDTLIVYAGDNGYIWGEHRLYAKHYPYEESIRVPYIVRPPKGYMTDPGRRADQMILNIDLAPTLLDMAGIPIPGKIQGESFLPVLNSSRASGRESWVYELFRDFPFGGRVPPHKALRTNRYKYIDWQLCKSPEIYDLHEDPREMNNLFGAERGKSLAIDLKAKLERLKEKYNLVNI
ncbi:MAG: sulfatase [Desulfobacterales bacterium]|nr:sulfatase [Desulfobacterales bacterium]